MDYPGEGHHHHHHKHEREFEEGYREREFEEGGQKPGGFQQGGQYGQSGFQQDGFQQGFAQPGVGGQYGGQFDPMGGQQYGDQSGGIGGQYGGQYGGQSGGMGGGYGGQRREFYIVSEMNGKVVDIQSENTSEGANIITWDKHSEPKRNQLWYMDNEGFIRSALNDMAFRNGERGHHLKTASAGMGDPRAQWRVDGNRIINQVGEVLDISGRHNRDGAEIISYQDDGGTNQHWRLDYVN